MAPMQVSMRASAATLAVLGLLAASFAGGASGAGSPNVAALQVGLRTHGLYQGRSTAFSARAPSGLSCGSSAERASPRTA
jgi:hypothetical protein